MKRLAAEDFDEQWDPFHTCVGHNPEDLQPFHNLFPSWDAFNSTLSGAESPAEGAATSSKPAGLKQYYKNKELYDLLRPDTEHLPYLYDNFQWPHCSVSQPVESLGVDFIAGFWPGDFWCSFFAGFWLAWLLTDFRFFLVFSSPPISRAWLSFFNYLSPPPLPRSLACFSAPQFTTYKRRRWHVYWVHLWCLFPLSFYTACVCCKNRTCLLLVTFLSCRRNGVD